ncbi:hypothetical protein J3362_03435 [Marinobacter sp. NFXS11]|uniref:capsular polysaccharide export protein, LipB/KpsS family n=1 Tax=Marinobacter sp. NFXS11 TaxID=2818432 RepID=UPI0032DEFBBB
MAGYWNRIGVGSLWNICCLAHLQGHRRAANNRLVELSKFSHHEKGLGALQPLNPKHHICEKNLMRNEVPVLLYVRPWNLEQMEHLARGVWGQSAHLTLTSEHKSVDTSGLVAVFESEYKHYDGEDLQYLSETESADIILRCRLLRSLPSSQTMRLLRSMESAVDRVLSENKPAAMLSVTVDSYVIDVFAHLCEQRGIPFIGLVPSFLKNHFRISTRGERVVSRKVSTEDIDRARENLIVDDYRPDFLVQSEREMRSQMRRLWFRNLPKPLWFYLRRVVTGEHLNYHFWSSQKTSSQYWSPWPRSFRGVSGSELAQLAENPDLPLIYVPLQMSPEATIDYWSSDTRWIDYEVFLLDLIRRYRGRWRFIVKEHPNLLGFRSPDFYKRLRAEPNCTLVAPKIPSNDLVTLCDGLLVCTGTAGFEALLRGKPVISESAPYYAPHRAFLPFEALNGKLPQQDINAKAQNRLLEYSLEGMLPGRFVNNGTWDRNNAQHRAWSDEMAESLKRYLAN